MKLSFGNSVFPDEFFAKTAKAFIEKKYPNVESGLLTFDLTGSESRVRHIVLKAKVSGADFYTGLTFSNLEDLGESIEDALAKGEEKILERRDPTHKEKAEFAESQFLLKKLHDTKLTFAGVRSELENAIEALVREHQTKDLLGKLGDISLKSTNIEKTLEAKSNEKSKHEHTAI